jgi:hypothetical protein
VKYIVYNCTSYPAGGLADRIKGLISCYGLSKFTNREFIINWSYPFPLTECLQPNKINWLPRKIEGTYREIYAMDIDLYNQNKDILKSGDFKEDIICVKTNIDFLGLYNYSFCECFNDLFKFKLINKSKFENLIGLSCRFGGDQSDWKDYDFSKKISYNFIVDKLLEISKEKNIDIFFICSDSSKFLDYCKERKLKFFSTKGTPFHIDYPGCTKEAYHKTFEDFLSLRECKFIYYIKGGFACTSALTSVKTAVCIE